MGFPIRCMFLMNYVLVNYDHNKCIDYYDHITINITV